MPQFTVFLMDILSYLILMPENNSKMFYAFYNKIEIDRRINKAKLLIETVISGILFTDSDPEMYHNWAEVYKCRSEKLSRRKWFLRHRRKNSFVERRRSHQLVQFSPKQFGLDGGSKSVQRALHGVFDKDLEEENKIQLPDSTLLVISNLY